MNAHQEVQSLPAQLQDYEYALEWERRLNAYLRRRIEQKNRQVKERDQNLCQLREALYTTRSGRNNAQLPTTPLPVGSNPKEISSSSNSHKQVEPEPKHTNKGNELCPKFGKSQYAR